MRVHPDRNMCIFFFCHLKCSDNANNFIGIDTMAGSLVICMWSQLSYPKVYFCRVELLGIRDPLGCHLSDLPQAMILGHTICQVYPSASTSDKGMQRTGLMLSFDLSPSEKVLFFNQLSHTF